MEKMPCPISENKVAMYKALVDKNTKVPLLCPVFSTICLCRMMTVVVWHTQKMYRFSSPTDLGSNLRFILFYLFHLGQFDDLYQLSTLSAIRWG